MKFKDFVVQGAICVNLHSEEKRPAIREMIEALRDAGGIGGEDVESIVRAIMKREEVGSTGRAPLCNCRARLAATIMKR